MGECIRTIDWGVVPIRKTFVDGMTLGNVELDDGTIAEVRSDFRTNQPFAVRVDSEGNLLECVDFPAAFVVYCGAEDVAQFDNQGAAKAYAQEMNWVYSTNSYMVEYEPDYYKIP